MIDHLKYQDPYYCPYCNNSIVCVHPWPDISRKQICTVYPRKPRKIRCMIKQTVSAP